MVKKIKMANEIIDEDILAEIRETFEIKSTNQEMIKFDFF
jgi:hypothetical protein